MYSMGSGTVRVSRPVLLMLLAQACSIGGSAGLLEGPDGCVVFVFGMATFSCAACDEAGRRLAVVQLVASKIATSQDVASAFGVSGVTLWKWGRDYTRGGVAALMRARTGPKGPIRLTAVLAARIVVLDATGLTLLHIAAQTGVDRSGACWPRCGRPVRRADPRAGAATRSSR